jgi:hypothetical protein
MKVEKWLVMAWLKKIIVASLVVFTMTVSLASLAQAGEPDERDLRGARRDRLFPPRQLHKQREALPAQQRLSPEERRQLRRDIKDAGREIYPAP